MDKAKFAIVTMGTVAGTIKHFIESEKIKDVGLVRIKSFRPFPDEELADVLKNVEAVGVLEKDISPGSGGALFHEMRGVVKKPMASFIGGLGGRDITLDHLRNIFDLIRKKSEKTEWIW